MQAASENDLDDENTLEGSAGKVFGLVAISRDITDRRT